MDINFAKIAKNGSPARTNIARGVRHAPPRMVKRTNIARYASDA